jgi:flavin reductase (DIM6/NTAB) family NADH-FMN oxidoreductase RutF
LPSAESTAAIERLTRAINSIDNAHDLCVSKVDVAGRMTAAHMTLIPSEAVSALRALECPMQLEARIEGKTNFMTQERVIFLNRPVTVELDVLRVHLDTSIVFRDVHPNMWKPLMNCLREAYRTSSAIPWTR